jgi:hypothetical protein
VSRYTLRQDSKYEVVVGYDRPLDSYFVQVVDERQSKELRDLVMILWVGTSRQEIVTVERLADLVQEWAPIPEAILERLRREKA